MTLAKNLAKLGVIVIALVMAIEIGRFISALLLAGIVQQLIGVA